MKSSILLDSLKENLNQAYALHRIILDERGNPVDYKFIDVNDSFEQFTGLKADDIIGKTAREIIPNIENSEFDWIRKYGQVALYNETSEFTAYSEHLKKYYEIKSFSPQMDYFITIFSFVKSDNERIRKVKERENDLYRLTQISLNLNKVESEDELITFVTDTLMEEFPDSVIIFNTSDESEEFLELRRISGINEGLISKILHTVGYSPYGKKFKLIEKFKEYYQTNYLQKFSGSFYDFAGSEVSESIAETIEKMLGVKAIYTIGLHGSKNFLGNIHILLLKSEYIRKNELVEFIAHHTSALLLKFRVQQELKNSQEQFRNIGKGALDAVIMTDEEGLINYWNPAAEKMFGYKFEEIRGKNPHQKLMPEKYNALYQKAWKQFQKDGTGNAIGKVLELNALRANGEEFPAEIALNSVKMNGKYFALAYVRDITEKRKIENELKDKQLRLELAIDAVEHGLWDWNLETNETYFSPAYYKMLGYKDRELPMNFDTFNKLLHPEDKEVFLPKLQKYLSEGTAFEQEFRLLCNDGSYKWILGKGKTFLRDDSGKPFRTVGVHIDIDSRKRAEETLNIERQRLANIIKGTNVGTWEWNIQTGETVFNERWAEIIGYTLEELAPISIDTWMKFAHPDDLKKSGELLEKHFNGELEYYEFESRMKHKNGNWIWVLDRGKVFSRTENNKPLMMMGTHQDVTERKNKEDELKTILETAIDGFFIANLKGEILEVNTAFCELLQYSKDEMLNMSIPDIEAKEKPEETKAHIDLLMKQGFDRFETKHRRKDGNIVDVEISVTVVKSDELKLVVFVRDITEKKAAEEKVRESETKLNYFFTQSTAGFFFMMLDEPVDWKGTDDKEALLDYIMTHQRMTKVNKAMLDQYGASEEDFIGLTPNELFSHDLEHGRYIWRGLFDKGRWHIETYEQKLDGTPIMIDGDYMCLFDDEGRITGHFGVQLDITEQKKTQNKIKESELKFRTLFETLPTGVTIADKKGEIINSNETAEKILGLSKTQQTQRAIDGTEWKIIRPDGTLMPQNEYASVRALKENRPVKNVEMGVIRCKDDIAWIIVNAAPVPELGVVISYQDITELKKAEEAIRESEEKFRQITENMNEVFWLRSADNSEMIYISPAYEKVWGRSCQSLYDNPQSFADAVYQEDKPLVFTEFEKYSNNGKFDLEYRIFLPNGELRWVHARSFPVKDENDNIIRHTGIAVDITDRKKAEQETDYQKNLLNALYELLPIGIGLNDFETGRFIDANKKLLEPTGYTKEEFLNLSFWDITPIEYEPKEAVQIKSLKEKGEFGPYEKEYIRKDGTRYPVLLNGVLVTDLKGRQLIWVVIEDITERKEGEEKLKKFAQDMEWTNWELQNEITVRKETEEKLKESKEKAESANKAKSEFLANMSHEIRTPMNSILGFSEVMLNTVNDKKLKGYLNTILNSGKTLLSLINDILDLSKIEAGRIEISPEPIDVRTIINEISELFQLKTQDKQIELIVKIDDNCPSTIIADEIRLRQILLNIVGNAVKFTLKGFVEISLEILNIKNGFLDMAIAVKDTGIGIPENDKEGIFDSFSQQSGQDNRVFGGTGLGLSISKKLVELMNGRIELKSEVNKGSLFTIKLFDLKYSNEIIVDDNKFRWDENEVDFKNSTVLIVDDVQYNTDLVVSFLEKYNLMLLTAGNGKIAIDIINIERPDLILMDIRMPVMNGYEATEIIKSNDDTANIPVIALTASTMHSEAEKIINLFDGYIRKPVMKNSLINELIKFLPFYTNKADKNYPEEQNISTLDDLPVSEEMKSEFKKEFSLRTRKLADTMILDDFGDYVIELIAFAEKFNNNKLLHKINKLKGYIEEFDFDNITESMNDIENMFN